MGEVAVIEPRPNIAAGARPMAIVPTDMDTAYRLAKAVVLAKMAPPGLETPEKAMIAIMHGLEIGLTPLTALQRIAVVNGRPTIWGDAAIGLVRASGLVEYIRETIEGDGDSMVAICESKRKGEPHPIVTRFTAADAKAAGLWNKAGPWQQYRRRMMQMRARAFNLRDGYADVLGGLYLREEIEDESPRHAPPAPPSIPGHPDRALIKQSPDFPMPDAAVEVDQELERVKAAPVEALRRMPPPPPPLAEPKTIEPATVPQESTFDPDKIRKNFAVRASQAKDREALATAWDEIVEPFKDEFFPGDLTEVEKIYRFRRAELDDGE